MSKLSRADALEYISNWSNEDVLLLLRKNNLNECCDTIKKRQVNGDELLHLTEGKLSLWKHDLNRSQIWTLWSFVEEIKKCPEQYVDQKQKISSGLQDVDSSPKKLIEGKQQVFNNKEIVSEIGSWDSDFDEWEDENDFGVTEVQASPVVISKTAIAENNIVSAIQNYSGLVNGNGITIRTSVEILEEENTYANCDNVPENQYANCNIGAKCRENEQLAINKHESNEKSLAEQLREQLTLLKNSRKTNAVFDKKHDNGEKKNDGQKFLPRMSFLHTSMVVETINEKTQFQPKKNYDQVEENTSKVTGIIRNFDLVANLPTKTEESEDEYETFDFPSPTISKAGSKLSIDSAATHNSTDNIYHPNSIASHEEEGNDMIYESINEFPEEKDECENSINVVPPPLPPKPPSCSSLQSLHSNSSKAESERSPDKKVTALPQSCSNISLPIIDRASRPLPTPPDRQSYMEKPWFHNVTREQATLLIKEQSTYGNAIKDGYFLIRPSTTNPNNPLALVLWYKDRVYNVPVRKRNDNRFALGSVKPNEQSFGNVEEIVSFYKREELILYTNGIQMGSTKLTDTPSK